MVDRNWAYKGPQTEEDLRRFNDNLGRKAANGGIIIGYHGTSASIGKIIEESGFEDYTSVDGTVGVWFWEEGWRDNAISPGEKKANEQGDLEYAIIKAKLTNPAPDLSPFARPQWKANKDQIEILGVEYVPIGEKPKYDMSQAP